MITLVTLIGRKSYVVFAWFDFIKKVGILVSIAHGVVIFLYFQQSHDFFHFLTVNTSRTSLIFISTNFYHWISTTFFIHTRRVLQFQCRTFAFRSIKPELICHFFQPHEFAVQFYLWASSCLPLLFCSYDPSLFGVIVYIKSNGLLLLGFSYNNWELWG